MPTRFREIDPKVGADALAESVGLTSQIAHHLDSSSTAASRRRRLWLLASRSGITYREIAEACGLNVKAVEDGIRQARREALPGDAPSG